MYTLGVISIMVNLFCASIALSFEGLDFLTTLEMRLIYILMTLKGNKRYHRRRGMHFTGGAVTFLP